MDPVMIVISNWCLTLMVIFSLECSYKKTKGTSLGKREIAKGSAF